MIVESVSVLGFRNLVDCEVELGPGLNLFWGANGSGKTNLLEATYMALAGRSCRTRDDREAIAFGKSLCRTEARVGDAGRSQTFLASVSRSDGRRHLVDGTPAGSDIWRRRPALSVFMPDRLSLVKGPPSGRRAHLDGFCAALWPARDDTRRRYSRALAQRNALLGRIRAGGASTSTLDAWEAELGAAGVELIALRAEAVARMAAPFAAAAESLGLDRTGAILYKPRTDASEPANLAAEIAARRDADLARGYTSHGPHLDELALERDGRSLRRYGSQGQQRIALLALLFAERRVLIEDDRPVPLLLLDDVTSELDAERRGLLVEQLAGGGQALVTATEPDHLPDVDDRREIAIRDGRALSLSSTPGSEAAA